MLTALFLLVAHRVGQQPDPAFAGSWVGTLEYRDFSDDSREQLGTLLRIYRPQGSTDWVFRYVYDDGPKKVLQESQTIAIDWDQHKYKVSSQDSKDTDTYDLDPAGLKPGGIGVLVLTGHGTENSETVDIRQTLTIRPTHLEILRESRRKGKTFLFRHRYSFDRVGEK